MGEAARKKLARDASSEENLIPGTHRPAQPEAAEFMRRTLDVFRRSLPGYDFALFVIEKPEHAEARDPRFNYASTIERPDMIALLKAFIAQNEDMAAIDKAMSGEAQGNG
mgnify:CR=1 FL=1